MISANCIRFATRHDSDALRKLAELDSQKPLDGRVLVSEYDGTPAAALSLDDGRVIADPFQRTDHLIANLRVRAGAIRAHEITPSARERVRAALPSRRGNSVVVHP